MGWAALIGGIISTAGSIYASKKAEEGSEGAAAAQAAQFKAGLDYLMETERLPQYYRSMATAALGEMYGLPAPMDLGLGGGGFKDRYGNPVTGGAVGERFTVESQPGQIEYRENDQGDLEPVPVTYGGDEINYGFQPQPDTLNISPGGVNATPTDRAQALTQYEQMTSRADPSLLPESVDFGQEATLVTPGEARVEDYYRSLAEAERAKYSNLSGLPQEIINQGNVSYNLTPGGQAGTYDLLLSQVTQSGRPKMRPMVNQDGQQVLLADTLMEQDANPITGQPWGSEIDASGVTPIPLEHFKNYETYVSRTMSIPEDIRPSYREWHNIIFNEDPTSPIPYDRPAGYGGESTGPQLAPEDWLRQNVAPGSWLDIRLNPGTVDNYNFYGGDYVDPTFSTGFTPGAQAAPIQQAPTTLSGVSVQPAQEQAMLPAPTNQTMMQPVQTGPAKDIYGQYPQGYRPSGMNDMQYASYTPPPTTMPATQSLPPTQPTTLSGVSVEQAPMMTGVTPPATTPGGVEMGAGIYGPSAPAGYESNIPPGGVVFPQESATTGEYIPAGEAGPMSFYDRYKQGELYKATMGGLQAGEDAILRNMAATGGLRSGNTQDALARHAMDLEMQALNQYMGGLTSMAQLPTNAAAVANQYGQIGQTEAGGILGAARARQAGMGQIADVWSNYYANKAWEG